jgi:hypothetical protein
MELKTRLAALGLTVGLIGGGAAGVILSSAGVSGASTAVAVQDSGSPSTTTTPGTNDHPTREQFLADALAPLVKDGTITQAQADKVIAALEKAAPAGGRGHRRGAELGAAAKTLDMSEADLRTALQGGKTLAEVATSKGVDPKAVIDAMVAEFRTHLDERVKSGAITQAQADTRLAEATTRITDIVNNGVKGGPGRGEGAPPAGEPGGN